MPIIIPDYTSYVGSNLTKLSIKAPYSLQHDIDSSIEASGLSDALIENIRWSKAQGGIAILGGETNGNGLLQIKNASGDIICTLDKDGILIEGGNVVIKNGSDQTVIDSKGLVSESAFISSSANKVGGGFTQDITSVLPTYTDLTDASLSFTLDRQKIVLVLAQIYHYGSRTDAGSDPFSNFYSLYDFNLIVDGTPQYNGGVIGESGYGKIAEDNFGSSEVTTGTINYLLTLAAGSHTLKLAAELWSASSANAKAVCFGYKLTYIILGT